MKITSVLEEISPGIMANGPVLADSRQRFTGLIAATFDKSRKQLRTSIMVTSATGKAGVSFVCSGIAAELSVRDAKVLLVDAHALLTVASLAPRSVSALCRRVGSHPVWVLGKEELSELSGSHQQTGRLSVRAVLHELEQEFTYVVIDAPAMSMSTDASILSTSVFGTILLARRGRTGRAEVKDAYKTLTHFGGCVLGTVFNAH